MNEQDRRVIATKEKFHEAILALLEEKPIGSIQVKELCSRAGVNRGTFYLHYETPLDTLREIEAAFLEANLPDFQSYWREGQKLDYMEHLYRYILTHPREYRILMGPNGSPDFSEHVRVLSRDSVVEEWQKDWPDAGREEIGVVFDFVYAGTMQLILDWLQKPEEKRPTVDVFTNRIERLGHYAQQALRELAGVREEKN